MMSPWATCPGGKHPYLATASRIELRFDVSRLLSNEIAIKELVVIDPNVLLETNVEGKGNWILDTMVPNRRWAKSRSRLRKFSSPAAA